MGKYRKRPIVIDAVQFMGDNDGDCLDFLGMRNNPPNPLDTKRNLYIDTLEGRMLVSIGDWIIRGINGEFYPCKSDIFDKTYEKLEEK